MPAKDHLGRLRVGAAVGVGEDLHERVAALVECEVDVVIIDTAHGHAAKVSAAARWFKGAYPDTDLIVGNIATATAALDLIDAGVDALKVGIGPSAICTTRVISGVGVRRGRRGACGDDRLFAGRYRRKSGRNLDPAGPYL